MEVTEKKRPGTVRPATRNELIAQYWSELGRPPVDAQVLAAIQKHLTERLGASACHSPASIARVLADNGAELRHPGIIEADARWREAIIKNQASKFGDVAELASGERLNLAQAGTLITKLELLRLVFERDAGEALSELQGIAIAARQNAQAGARNQKLDEKARNEQSEIAEWLKIWLQTPSLFEDWLELRRRSKDFRGRFGHRDTGSQRTEK